jgi:hypothetical protein
MSRQDPEASFHLPPASGTAGEPWPCIVTCFCFLSVGLYTAVQCQSHAPNAVRAWPGSIPAFSPSFVHPSFTLLYSISQFPFGRWGSFLAKNTLELSSRLPTSCFPLPRSPTISTPEAFLPSYGPTRTSPAYIRIGRFLLR